MNIFFIPSWYPSPTDPLPGIFFREQAFALVNNFKDVNVGVSTWGQNDERLLLWAGKPFQSFSKLILKGKPKIEERELISGRLIEYFFPEFTWSSRIVKGNLKRISAANLKNLRSFKDQFGGVDIIHAHVGFPAGYIAKVISKMMEIPYVITEQMSPFPHHYYLDKTGDLRPDLRSAYQHAEQNIAISHALAARMKQYHLERIKIIPNLVDESFFKPADRPVNRIFTFFSLGRIVSQKGIDILLKAISKLKVNAKFRIGGDGPELNKYQQLARDLKIDNRITWLGGLDRHQALDEYQNCDAFVLPSRHESMGVVFVEAMACGKPVIATICGGPEEFIDESIGYLAQNGNVDDLVAKIISMIDNHTYFNGKIIREKFELQFASSVVTKKLREVYGEVIENHQVKK